MSMRRMSFLFSILLTCLTQIVVANDSAQEIYSDKACNDTDQEKYIYPENYEFTAALDRCGRQALGNGSRTTNCLLAKYTDLTSPCASCFGAAVHCAATKCFLQCSGDNGSNACLTCYKNNCEPDLVQCTGVQSPDLPKR